MQLLVDESVKDYKGLAEEAQHQPHKGHGSVQELLHSVGQSDVRMAPVDGMEHQFGPDPSKPTQTKPKITNSSQIELKPKFETDHESSENVEDEP